MLDLIIFFYDLIIIGLEKILKLVTFCPPHSKTYTIINKNIVLFLDESSLKDAQNSKMECFSDYYNEELPILYIKPSSCHNICIIYSHGNSSDLGSSFSAYKFIAEKTNCIVLGYEYPGYGHCKNKNKTEVQFLNHIKLAYYYVKNELKIDNIILLGFSLGTGISFDLACEEDCQIKGLILLAPYLSILRTYKYINDNNTYYFDMFDSVDKAKYLKCKTIILHGNKDTFISYQDGEHLAKKIEEYSKNENIFHLIDGATHKTILKNDETFKKINEFIAKVCPEISKKLNCVN